VGLQRAVGDLHDRDLVATEAEGAKASPLMPPRRARAPSFATSPSLRSPVSSARSSSWRPRTCGRRWAAPSANPRRCRSSRRIWAIPSAPSRAAPGAAACARGSGSARRRHHRPRVVGGHRPPAALIPPEEPRASASSSQRARPLPFGLSRVGDILFRRCATGRKRMERWFTVPITSATGYGVSLRLFCFPHAGGSAALFHRWPLQLPKTLELLGVQLPGRGSRFNEPHVRRLGALVEGLSRAMIPL